MNVEKNIFSSPSSSDPFHDPGEAKKPVHVAIDGIIKGEDVIKLNIKMLSTEDKYNLISNDPELLGSVTTTSSPALRASARVIQKMKMDSIRPTTPPPPPERKEQPKEERTSQKASTHPKVVTRSLWSNVEKTHFFEALNEYGKDFDCISHYVNSKQKRKDITDPTYKTKEHVRQIYYQSYNKVSKNVRFSDNVKKNVQELYALINYGEMRRKMISSSNKSFMKQFRNLIYRGSVTVRIKGKNFRIKTPSCKALRKLNQLEEGQEEIKLPARVDVMLKPATVDAWGRVQMLAQNPRIKAVLPLHKRVQGLLKTLQSKWHKPFNTKLCEQTMRLVVADDTQTPNDSTLWIGPAPNSVIHRPMVNLTEFLSSSSICLNAYEERIGAEIRGEMLRVERAHSHRDSPKSNAKRQRQDSLSDKKSPDLKKMKTEIESTDIIKKSADFGLKCDEPQPSTSFALHEVKLETQSESKLEPIIVDTAITPLEVPQPAVIIPDIKPKRKEKGPYKKKDIKSSGSSVRPLLNEETIKKIMDGWTLDTVADITVGDLYVMFGVNAVIQLEYRWIKKPITNPKNENTGLVTKLDDNPIKDSDKITNNDVVAVADNSLLPTIDEPPAINNKLKQLLLMANLMDRTRKKIGGCTCGHICDKSNKPKRLCGDQDSSGMLTPRTFISNKSYPVSGDIGVFRQPTLPLRGPFSAQLEGMKLGPNGIRNKQIRFGHRFKNGRNMPGKHIVVQRILPLQPGANTGYGVVSSQSEFYHQQTHKDLIHHLRNQQHFQQQKSVISLNGNGHHHNHNYHGPAKSLPSLDSSDDDEDDDDDDDNDSDDSDDEDSKSKIKVDDHMFGVKKETSKPPDEDEKPTPQEDPLPTTSASQSSNSMMCDDSLLRRINEDPGILSLMEISLPSPSHVKKTNDNSFSYSFNSSNSSPNMSPIRLLRENCGDSKWLEEHMGDFSLSSFLGHLENVADDTLNENTASNQMQLDGLESCHNDDISLISEPSVDYMRKFQEIAASMKAAHANGDKLGV